ncbi:hypothetical protein GTA08_BOTSDO01083 [Botryosphaeria dothidea]|uniref:Uncharacterized protein n=1 Tax=Botryosphaeria dothidea TaxID=55169 RepID=A0A8H4J4L8_9PEZI|nr:hypothetical protein GTA08_BOTSDO01083 [Botryosphaeria dothidea]
MSPATLVPSTTAYLVFLVHPNDARHERYFILTSNSNVPTSLSLPKVSLAELATPSGIPFGPLGPILKNDVIDLPSKLKGVEKDALEEHLGDAKYDGPDSEHGFVKTLLFEKEVDRVEIQRLKEVLGEEEADFNILSIDAGWEPSPNDSKAMATWALYERLDKAGKLET